MAQSLFRFSQLSLRDLFWVTFVLAIVLGWWLDRSRLASARDLYRWRFHVLAGSWEAKTDETITLISSGYVVEKPGYPPEYVVQPSFQGEHR